MFQTKKAKIKAWLQAKPQKTAFDELLGDYLDKSLQKKLAALGVAEIALHIDWLEDHKCIGIQGRYEHGEDYYLDIQIYPEEYLFAADPDEPDGGVYTPLPQTKTEFYRELEARL